MDDKYEDVDFTIDPNYVFGDLGLKAFSALPEFKDNFPVLTESQIRAAIEKMDAENTGMEWLVKEIKNQGNEGSCVGNMATQGLQVLQAIEYGLDKTYVLSAMSVYRNIGNSPQSGAMISDALDFVTQYGALPESNAQNIEKFGADVCTPATGWGTIGRYSTWSDKRKTVASGLKLQEAYICRSVLEMLTAECNGWPVGVGRAGHSILHVRPTIRNDRLASIYSNSWSLNWGFAAGTLSGGFGVDTNSLLNQAASWAICFRSMVGR